MEQSNKRILIFSISLGAVAAWLTANHGKAQYNFSGVYVTCEMANSYYDAAVKNTGNTTAHIRVNVIINYRRQIKDENGNTIGYGTLFPQPPVYGTDYTLDINHNDWVQGADGYYYYKYPVAPGATTTNLITGFDLKGGTPKGYEFRFEYLCEAIQSDPNGTPAAQAWGATVDGNNHITGANEITWE